MFTQITPSRPAKSSIAARFSVTVLALALGVIAASPAVMADRDHGRDRQEVRRDERGYVLDNRYNHNHYYPPRGQYFDTVPRAAAIVRYGHTPYYYHEGIWYRPYGPRFVVVGPPIGLFVSALPPFYTTVWWGGIPYYYANDAYYVWNAEHDGYIVTNPPPNETEVSTQPANGGGDLFIYPKNGQNADQQAKDRYECHSWASNQTGFDPTQPLDEASRSQAAAKREDYQRAMTACLEARGYSVK
jgi:hypothetical protein